MFHLIKFNTDAHVDVEISPRHRLKHLRIRAGTIARVILRPHIAEAAAGPVEVADLFFQDGIATRHVPFKKFRFIE